MVCVDIVNGYPIDKANKLCKLIDRQPTAYDVDKVVERMEEESYQHFEGSRSVDLNFAIETVRAGTGR